MEKEKNYANTLKECAKIADERQAAYGEATKSIKLATEILDTTFGIKLTPKEFVLTIVALKLSRNKFQMKNDNFLDSINYLAIYLNL